MPVDNVALISSLRHGATIRLRKELTLENDSRELAFWQEALDELVACGLVEELFITGDPEPRYQISASMTTPRPHESSHFHV
jgi:hypothetical protein